MTDLLSRDHTILERPFMKHLPFGVNPDGTKVRDTTGVRIRAFVEYLEEYMDRAQGPGAGRQASQELCRLLNERLTDPAYHVESTFLKNTWNSYSYEFACYLGEFAKLISGDPSLPARVGEEKYISVVIQALGRPFSLERIYQMFPYFGEKFSALILGVVTVTKQSAVLTMRYQDSVLRQFGPYRLACTELICQSAKNALAAVPQKVHRMPKAAVRDVKCVALGDDRCEWELTWTTEPHQGFLGAIREFVTQPGIPVDKTAGAAGGELPTADLLSKDHTILERPFMQFPPFGVDPDGIKIRDATGVKIRAFVDYLEEYMERTQGPGAGARAVKELCRLLNERIPDPAHHIDPQFLKNNWNSYSYEFVCYLGEFCKRISGDPLLPARVGEEKFISAVIQTLGRPFALERIYQMFPHFGEKFSVLILGVTSVTDRSAVLTMRYPDSVSRQFGPYLLACTELVCQSAKNALAAVPEKVHHMPRATIKDVKCVAQGDDRCEWELTWVPHTKSGLLGTLWGYLSLLAYPVTSRTLPQPPIALQPLADAREPAVDLLSKEHRILERPFMEFRPYGVDKSGKKVRDISGAIVKANVDQLQDTISRMSGEQAGDQAVEDLCRLLNERIQDPAYHVTPPFLKNVWNSYSYEFVCFLREFCERLSGDPNFHYHVGRGRHLSPIIQALGRPFPMSRIFMLWPHFAQKFAKGSVVCDVGDLTESSAILRLKFTESTYRQFGPYRKACARMVCEASKGGISMVPNLVHSLPPATVKDRTCIVNGDEWCEWQVTWSPQPRQPFMWPVGGMVSSAAVFAYLRWLYPVMGMGESLAIAVVPALVSWATTRMGMHTNAAAREALIQEQMQVVEARHEELREVYLEQEQTQVELRRRVNQLTTLHQAGLLFVSTFDRETLLQNVLQTLIHQLHYDHAMISFFDRARQTAHDSRLFGASEEAATYARSHEVPVTDPFSPEGLVLLQGRSLFVVDIDEVWSRLHPRNRQLVSMLGIKSMISVPIKIKDQVLGSLTVDRTREHGLSQEDLDLLVTLAGEVAIALDNAEAYRQIEQLNIGLEAKVRQRTAELEQLNRALTEANEKLHELDRLKSEFFANVSHEFRTPLTLSLGTFKTLLKSSPSVESKELLQTGLRNTSRLLFLINEFLDLAKFDSGLMELRKQCIDLAALVRAVAANFESAERRRVHFQGVGAPAIIEADLGQMKKVLYNLLSNAFKFSDPDKGEVWIRLSSREDRIELEVEDNGIGIPRDQMDRIFERFAQVERRATRRYEGTGIGLALVKEMVALHGGTIRVESELDRGSTFIISLPRGNATIEALVTSGDDDPTVIPDSRTDFAERGSPMSPALTDGGDRPLVLVVDDNADMRGYLARLLSNQYRIILAKDGVEGMEQAHTFHPDLILADIMMPRMSGHDLLKAIRSDEALRATPVVFLTARAGTEARVESLEAGADDFIAKPFDEHEIIARVNNLIRLRAQERELIELQKEKMTRFLPAQLVDVIFSEQAEDVLKSHRAEISVVFIDLRGFTAFAETAEPEDVMAVLEEYQSEMGRLIAEHHGVIERFSGDAIMIFFNDPVPVRNHAEQAVRLALAMRAEVVQLKRKWVQRGIDLGAGIGVATGYATLGLVGFEQRKDYAAIGAVTNLAARLCGEARHGQILISERVRHFVKDFVHAESVGTLTLKGFQKPVPAYNVAGLDDVRPLGKMRKPRKAKNN